MYPCGARRHETCLWDGFCFKKATGMRSNNYLDSIPVGNHRIKMGEDEYTVLFDQYNSLGFQWTPEIPQSIPHYYQNEADIFELQNLLKTNFSKRYSQFIFDTCGSLAIEHAIQYSQIYTKARKVLKFSGCYHGSSQAIREIQDVLTLPTNASNLINSTSTVSYEHSLEEIERCLSKGEYCCILIDPNFCDDYIDPPNEYYRELRALCDKHNVFIVFDEMRTGFRSKEIWAANQVAIDIDVVVGAKAVCNGLPFSFTAFHERIGDSACLQIVDEASTGFSYNPLVIETVKTTLRELKSLFFNERHVVHFLENYSKKSQSNPSYHVIVKGNYFVLEFKTHKSILAANFCEAYLKKEGFLCYRSENRVLFALMPIFLWMNWIKFSH